VTVLVASRENSSDSSSTVPKSTIVAAAITSCPNGVVICPVSLSSGTSTDKAVADSTIAMNSGASIRSAARSP
jgi:hypothetical protein